VSVEVNFHAFWLDVVQTDVLVAERCQVDVPVPEVVAIVSFFFQDKKKFARNVNFKKHMSKVLTFDILTEMVVIRSFDVEMSQF